MKSARPSDGMLRCTMSMTVLAAMMTASGCVVVEQGRAPVSRRSAAPDRVVRDATGRPAPALHTSRPRGFMVTTSNVRAAIDGRGAVPYDQFSLPLVSPDGRFVATQTGSPPTWPTVLAEPDAEAPTGTHIEVYLLDRAGGPATLISTVEESAVLGRSCDMRGFLIEAPQRDGSRWIGRAQWETGTVQWLVADEYVNAFATLGPDQRLVWSRRPIDGERFGLVVRKGQTEWSAETLDTDWLMPTWSGRGDGLFALTLRRGTLRALFLHATEGGEGIRTLAEVVLANGASMRTAYQSLNGQVVVSGLPDHAVDVLVFLHPANLCAAVWTPMAARRAAMTLLRDHSLHATLDPSGYALVSTNEALHWQSTTNLRDDIELISGVLVPRAVASEEWPYLLLSPGETSVRLTAMRLLGPEELEDQEQP